MTVTVTSATTTAPAPLLNGQLIGIAYHAVAAVRDRILIGSGLTFPQSVALKAVVDGLGRDGAVDRLTSTLKITGPEVHALLAALAEAGLIDAARTTPTEKGEALHRGFTDEVAALAERLYGGLPAADREIAARALAHVTERANAELATR
ncbi:MULTISPECIES: hypothetical protein [unclassified Streptomyces]|uniref:hypothetical protein n=1 Tax=unclassified Streptomyces TaxID=2593676 RepID=UPI0006FB566D|nr:MULTISPECIES: hypothetical protein [unclassified Streptomyces]KQX50757.1 hypothetical protein ASD33_11930 [Streptomyces sp. Root1304]KRA84922.1 hypothetical protein ASE09_11935 [Streptomyces sp. Root66D1]